MPTHVKQPTVVEPAGTKPKIIEEYVGVVNSGAAARSIARVKNPGNWAAPGQTPDLDGYTMMLRRIVRVTSRSGSVDIRCAEAAIAPRGEWVQCSAPGDNGTEYVALCVPAFSSESVHRDTA